MCDVVTYYIFSFILGPNRISIFNFIDIELDVKGCRNVYESLDKYVTVKWLDYDNKYPTEQYGLQVIFEANDFHFSCEAELVALHLSCAIIFFVSVIFPGQVSCQSLLFVWFSLSLSLSLSTYFLCV